MVLGGRVAGYRFYHHFHVVLISDVRLLYVAAVVRQCLALQLQLQRLLKPAGRRLLSMARCKEAQMLCVPAPLQSLLFLLPSSPPPVLLLLPLPPVQHHPPHLLLFVAAEVKEMCLRGGSDGASGEYQVLQPLWCSLSASLHDAGTVARSGDRPARRSPAQCRCCMSARRKLQSTQDLYQSACSAHRQLS
jgi:hypothetical protein